MAWCLGHWTPSHWAQVQCLGRKFVFPLFPSSSPESTKRIIYLARNNINIIYRTFYKYQNPDCLKQLYQSFVRPHFEYAEPVKDPYCASHVYISESIQMFAHALQIPYKAWKEHYTPLLERCMHPLAKQRKLKFWNSAAYIIWYKVISVFLGLQ